MYAEVVPIILEAKDKARKMQLRHEKDGIVFINPMKIKDAGEKIVHSLLMGRHISDDVTQYVEKEHRVNEWAEKNIDAISNSRKKI